MTIRVALVGFGAAARNIHLPAYARLGAAVELVAVCDADPAAAARARRTLGGAVYDDPRRMLEAERPDIVSICTPPACHREQTLLALEHGCHVFCEKPLADTMAHADEIIGAADRAGRQVAVNTQFPHMAIHAAAKAQIGTAAFGRLLFLHAWQACRPSAASSGGWRSGPEGGLSLEFGVHVLELVRFFFADEPARLYCQIPRAGRRDGAEALSLLSLEFADGRAASIVLDRLGRGPERYLDMRLEGERGSIDTSIGGDLRIELGLRTRARRPFFDLHVVKGGKAILYNGTQPRVLAKDGLNPFATATAAHFGRLLEALAAGTTPPASARDHRRTLALALAAYESARSGMVVDLPRRAA